MKNQIVGASIAGAAVIIATKIWIYFSPSEEWNEAQAGLVDLDTIANVTRTFAGYQIDAMSDLYPEVAAWLLGRANWDSIVEHDYAPLWWLRRPVTVQHPIQ
jgi:hypothetical protein